jgi:hypothetical protein
MNPYTQFLTDEASGLQYINPRWEAWEEGKKEGRREVVETAENYLLPHIHCAPFEWKEQKARWGLK